MATRLIANKLYFGLCGVNLNSLFTRQFRAGIIIYNQQGIGQTKSTGSTSSQINENVPGLSEAVLTAEEPVGPGASKTGEYKVPEYFNFNKMSYFEAEVEMTQYRCPQPSAVTQ